MTTRPELTGEATHRGLRRLLLMAGVREAGTIVTNEKETKTLLQGTNNYLRESREHAKNIVNLGGRRRLGAVIAGGQKTRSRAVEKPLICAQSMQHDSTISGIKVAFSILARMSCLCTL